MNRQTRSPSRGVTRDKTSRRWLASIRYAGREFFLGGYETEEEAIVAYNHGVLVLYGPTGKPIPIETRDFPRPEREERIKADVVARLGDEL